MIKLSKSRAALKCQIHVDLLVKCICWEAVSDIGVEVCIVYTSMLHNNIFPGGLAHINKCMATNCNETNQAQNMRQNTLHVVSLIKTALTDEVDLKTFHLV